MEPTQTTTTTICPSVEEQQEYWRQKEQRQEMLIAVLEVFSDFLDRLNVATRTCRERLEKLQANNETDK